MQCVSDTVSTADGTCPVTLHLPDAAGPLPGVIMYPDVGGVRQTFHDMASELAGFGYVVLLPDVYYRHHGYRSFSMPSAFIDAEERARMMALGDSLTPDVMARDATAYFEFLTARPEVRGSTYGLCGYCRGGRVALTVAGRCPDGVAAVASLHGSQLASESPHSPHLLVGRIHAKVYVAAAQNDPLFPAEQADRLSAALGSAEVDYTIETYHAEHGFAVPDNPGFDSAAAQRHWAVLRDFFGSAMPRLP